MRGLFMLPALLALAAGCESRSSAESDSGGVAASDLPAATPAGDAAPARRTSRETVLVDTAIMDEHGFGGPMVAARARIPADWHTRGGVGWDRRSECVSNHLRLNWLAQSPDAREALEIMPGLAWQLLGTDIPMNPCPPLAIRDARDFLLTVAQRYPGARALSFRERPELAPPVQAVNGARAYANVGELLIAYASPAGEVRELLIATLNVSELQGNVAISVPLVMAYRVMGRDPDPAFIDGFINSMKVDTRWQAVMQETSLRIINEISARQRQDIATWHAGEMARINARGAADRAAIRAQTQREVSQIYSNVWRQSQATDDRIHRRTLEAIGEYNTYADPASGGVVRESTDYNRVIRTQEGNYISTNDPYLNPAGSQELERIP